MDLPVPIPNRRVAGQALAEALKSYAGRDDVIVLALPRGGVPVAAEVARALGVPLDVMLVRKLGLPGHPELAMGAIASGGVRVMNDDVVRRLSVSPAAIEAVAEAEGRELARRERVYRGERPWPDLRGRCVILVDDGLATGATMHAAIDAVRAQQPACIVVAVPVAPPDTVRTLEALVDEVVCPLQPQSFMAIGQWYQDFTQTSDDEVITLLDELAKPQQP
ncbi:MAG TPA: phosphoribosyltransferase [Gammaproteobacteria bacterium]|nr:phosphoribosyltransferase [Gammaproteobacteria bacterium]